MQIATRTVLYDEISRFNPVTLRIEPGEIFQVETELNTGDWLHALTDEFTLEKVTHHNPASGCIYVEQARPGDMLAIKIVDIHLADLGYTGFAPGMNPFPDWIRGKEWGRIVTKTVKIEQGQILWSDHLKIPVQPMIGVLGTAPEIGVPKTTENGPFGGNLDIQEITTGSTVLLPVYVSGGLLHVGDVHAIQGDGEICCAGGIETRALLTLQVDVAPKPKEMTWPRIETPEHIISIGCARPAEDAFRIAVQELIWWLVNSYGFTDTDAFLLLGQILQARCTQFVDPLYTYICKVHKKFLNR